MVPHGLQLFNFAYEIKTTYEFTPAGALASLCHPVLSQIIFYKNFSGYHAAGENASVTAVIMIEVNEVNACRMDNI